MMPTDEQEFKNRAQERRAVEALLGEPGADQATIRYSVVWSEDVAVCVATEESMVHIAFVGDAGDDDAMPVRKFTIYDDDALLGVLLRELKNLQARANKQRGAR